MAISGRDISKHMLFPGKWSLIIIFEEEQRQGENNICMMPNKKV